MVFSLGQALGGGDSKVNMNVFSLKKVLVLGMKSFNSAMQSAGSQPPPCSNRCVPLIEMRIVLLELLQLPIIVPLSLTGPLVDDVYARQGGTLEQAGDNLPRFFNENALVPGQAFFF